MLIADFSALPLAAAGFRPQPRSFLTLAALTCRVHPRPPSHRHHRGHGLRDRAGGADSRYTLLVDAAPEHVAVRGSRGLQRLPGAGRGGGRHVLAASAPTRWLGRPFDPSYPARPLRAARVTFHLARSPRSPRLPRPWVCPGRLRLPATSISMSPSRAARPPGSAGIHTERKATYLAPSAPFKPLMPPRPGPAAAPQSPREISLPRVSAPHRRYALFPLAPFHFFFFVPSLFLRPAGLPVCPRRKAARGPAPIPAPQM